MPESGSIPKPKLHGWRRRRFWVGIGVLLVVAGTAVQYFLDPLAGPRLNAEIEALRRVGEPMSISVQGARLAAVMALQAGQPLLDFSYMDENKEAYFAAVQAGLDNYAPMAEIFRRVLQASKQNARG